MSEQAIGPLLSDEEFFQSCLKLDMPGMEAVKKAVLEKDFPAARKEIAAHIRKSLRPDLFFQIPYEVPENIYMLPGESDAEAAERIINHTLVSVGVPCEYGKGQPVDWEANPTYNGYKEWTWQLSRHNDVKHLAHEYHKTKDPRLAEAAAELMHSWMKQAVRPEADCIGYLTKCWRTIECGIRMGSTWPYILFTFYQTPAFTDDLLVDWYKSVWEHAERLSRNHMTGNWLIMEMNGLGQIAILYPELVKAEEWLAQAEQSLEEELDRQIYPDGFQYELTTNYHNVVIMNYQRFTELAKTFGTEVSSTLLEKLARACALDIRLMMPDKTLPDLNDGCRLKVPEVSETRRRILPEDPLLKWAAGEGGEEPAETSLALEWSGFAVLRTGWTEKDAWALMDAAPFGRAHQHEDKLSVLFYANGKLLLSEGGNYAYDTSKMREYVLSTRAHNTVRVDGQDQNRRKDYTWEEADIRRKAKLEYHFGDAWDYAKSSYGELEKEGYGPENERGCIHSRSLYFLRDKEQPLLIIADRLHAETAHTWEAFWHIDSEEQKAPDGRLAAFTDTDVAWSAGDGTVLSGQEESEWQGFLATGTGQGMYRAAPCISVKLTGEDVRLVTVIAPYKAGEDRLLAVQADTAPENEEILLTYESGRTVKLSEERLRKGLW